MITVKKGYILLTHTGTFLTNLIKCYTKKAYNHASIAFDSELTEVYSFGRKYANNPWIGGFVREDLRSELFSRATCAVYSFEMTDVQWKKMKQYIETFEAQKERYHYHFLGLFGFLLKRPIHRKNAFFCSQFVATVLAAAGIASFQKPCALIAPYDLTEVPGIQLVFQGKLSDYLKHDDEMEKFAFPRPLLPAEM